MLKKVDKKEAQTPKKIQAMIPPSLYAELTSIKDYYQVSMNRVVNEALHDFAKRQLRKIRKEQKAEKDKQLPKKGSLPATADAWIENGPLGVDDPLPPLSQIKSILEKSGNEDIDPVAARKRLDQDRRKNDLYSWGGWLKKTVTKELREENKKKLLINNTDS